MVLAQRVENTNTPSKMLHPVVHEFGKEKRKVVMLYTNPNTVQGGPA